LCDVAVAAAVDDDSLTMTNTTIIKWRVRIFSN